MDPAMIGALSASIAVPIAFALLRRLLPAPPAVDVARSLEDLGREYRKWELLALPLLFTLAPLAALLWWQIFLGLAAGSGFSQDGAVYALRPSRIAWLLPALFLGILSAGPPMEAIYRRLLGPQRFREYQAYTSLRHGFDTKALEKPLYLGGGALAALGAALLADWYVLFTPTEIRLDPLLGLRKRVLRYEDLVSIRTAPAFVAPNGNIVRRREYALRFSDKSSWNTKLDPAEAEDAQLQALMQAVSERSGVPITELKLLGRDEFR